MLKHTTGNILDLAEAGEFDIVVQGCNCFNAMGGGIAHEIRHRYPNVAAVDSSTLRGDYGKLGTWTAGAVDGKEHRFLIMNAYTQFNMSTGQDVFEYLAFELICQKLAHMYGDVRIGLPYIGMGLARGDKSRIMNIIQKFAQDVSKSGGSVTLVEFGR